MSQTGTTRHPTLSRFDGERAANVQPRVAYAVTTFAGSMVFVYIHIAWFAVWILFRVEKYPFGLLTMIVSLEAISLSTFVMISQNRWDARRSALADHQWTKVQEEDEQKRRRLDISEQILELTTRIAERDVALGRATEAARGKGEAGNAAGAA